MVFGGGGVGFDCGFGSTLIGAGAGGESSGKYSKTNELEFLDSGRGMAGWMTRSIGLTGFGIAIDRIDEERPLRPLMGGILLSGTTLVAGNKFGREPFWFSAEFSVCAASGPDKVAKTQIIKTLAAV